MFTGLISDCGRIIAVTERDAGRLFRIATRYDAAEIADGASIACNGVCLTVVGKSAAGHPHWFEVEAWAEALALTNAADWVEGSVINLERSLKMGDELGGHMVSGHVDGRARVVSVSREGAARRFVLEAPDELMRYIAPKGSIALDGTSLTVNAVEGNRFDVLLIRHTLNVTTWGDIVPGKSVNIEVDQLARHVVRLLDHYHNTMTANAGGKASTD